MRNIQFITHKIILFCHRLLLINLAKKSKDFKKKLFFGTINKYYGHQNEPKIIFYVKL